MDSLSKLFAVFILIMCLVFVPLYQVLEKQDSLVYQEVRKEVTAFVDNVRHKGYITPAMYNDLQTALSFGDQVYDVKITHGQKVFVPVYDDPADPSSYQNEWEEHTNEYVNEQILKTLFPDSTAPIDDKSRVYYLHTGDSFHVEIERLSDTKAERMRSFFFMTSDTQNLWYGISYGGLVLNENY